MIIAMPFHPNLQEKRGVLGMLHIAEYDDY